MMTGNAKLNADFAGRILVKLETGAGRVTSVEIDSTRPQGVTQVFAGRAPDDVVGMLGLIFSLCSTAQTVAGLTAVEAARGQTVPDGQAAARDILRQAEMLAQTAMRVLMDWPRLLELSPAAAAVRAALGAQSGLETALFGGPGWKVPGGTEIKPDVDAVRASATQAAVEIDRTLNQDGLAEKLLAALDERGLNGFGALADGTAPETGALTRQWDNAKVAQARKTYGAGLRARLWARLADLKDLPVAMTANVDRLCPCTPVFESPQGDGQGEATVETARGALTHRVRLKGGVIDAYEIDAPTDVNFLNDGVVTQGLMGANAVDSQTLRAAAELHVLAVDPCVSCALEIVDA